MPAMASSNFSNELDGLASLACSTSKILKRLINANLNGFQKLNLLPLVDNVTKYIEMATPTTYFPPSIAVQLGEVPMYVETMQPAPYGKLSKGRLYKGRRQRVFSPARRNE